MNIRRISIHLAVAALLAGCSTARQHTTTTVVGKPSSGTPAAATPAGALITAAELNTIPGLQQTTTTPLPTGRSLPPATGPCGAALKQPNLLGGRAIQFNLPSGSGGDEFIAVLPPGEAQTYMDQIIHNLNADCPAYTRRNGAGLNLTAKLEAVIGTGPIADQAAAFVLATTVLRQTSITTEIDLRYRDTYAQIVLLTNIPPTTTTIKTLASTAAQQLATA